MNRQSGFVRKIAFWAVIGAAVSAWPAAAKEREAAVTLVACEASIGSIAIVEGDTQGWTKFGLGSPRELIAALATESGCFSLHNPASGTPANFLMNVIAGDKEEVDKGVELAKGAAVEGLVRSGAAGGLIRGIPGGGALLGMFGGLGGKKKIVAAGIRIISPANGMTLVAGSGDARKSSLTFGGGGGWSAAAGAAGYANSGDGKLLTEAFIKAFNNVVGQSDALVAAAQPAVVPASPIATAAVDTRMMSAPTQDSSVVRAVRANSTLTPTGQRNGLFVEVKDGFGTQGWVSVEDLR